MNAIDTIEKIIETKVVDANLRFCLVNSNKLPYKIDGTLAKPNNVNDFCDLYELLQCKNLSDYAGVGVSVQASNICAIDVDNCFSNPFDIKSIDARGNEILNKFKDFAYCEFSFSGKGLRILFRGQIINNYSDKYYIKNEKNHVEYYQPTTSYRYVTLTGRAIANNDVEHSHLSSLFWFLDTYMKKPEKKKYEYNEIPDTKSFEELIKMVKKLYLTNFSFQDLWFSQAPGSGKDESERDYKIIAFLFENVTQNKDKLKQLFETSPYFNSKDYKHMKKWENQNGRYYEYVYGQIRRTH